MNKEAFWLHHQLPETGGQSVECGFSCQEFHTICVALLGEDEHFAWQICTNQTSKVFQRRQASKNTDYIN